MKIFKFIFLFLFLFSCLSFSENASVDSNLLFQKKECIITEIEYLNETNYNFSYDIKSFSNYDYSYRPFFENETEPHLPVNSNNTTSFEGYGIVGGYERFEITADDRVVCRYNFSEEGITLDDELLIFLDDSFFKPFFQYLFYLIFILSFAFPPLFVFLFILNFYFSFLSNYILLVFSVIPILFYISKYISFSWRTTPLYVLFIFVFLTLFISSFELSLEDTYYINLIDSTIEDLTFNTENFEIDNVGYLEILLSFLSILIPIFQTLLIIFASPVIILGVIGDLLLLSFPSIHFIFSPFILISQIGLIVVLLIKLADYIPTVNGGSGE